MAVHEARNISVQELLTTKIAEAQIGLGTGRNKGQDFSQPGVR